MQDYMALKKALLIEYKNQNNWQLLYSVSSLEKYKNLPCLENDEFLKYCYTFDRIVQHCIEKKVLMKYIAGVQFIHGLPPVMASSLIQDFAIDTEDLATIDYQKELEYIMQQTASDKAIQHMNTIYKETQQAIDLEKPL